MSTKIRLGPIAVFLAVIAIVFASLAMLTISTSRADSALAERFAKVTALKYELEAEGQKFLQAADEFAAGAGKESLPEGAYETGDGLSYLAEKEGYTLEIDLVKEDSGYSVQRWQISKLWEEEDPFEDLWLG